MLANPRTKIVITLFSLALLLLVGSSKASANTQDIKLQEDDIVLEEISDEEAKKNLIEVSGYTVEEANLAVYGNEKGIQTKNSVRAARWSTVTHHARNAKIVGQVKLNNGRIVDAAPKTTVIPDTTCDLVRTEYSNLTVIDSYSVRLKSKYRVVCGAIPFNETVNTVKKLR